MNILQCPHCKEHKGSPKEFYNTSNYDVICINCQVERTFDKELSLALFIEERQRLKKRMQELESVFKKM
jgi:hypothetical protein